jgi:hypothetical protein
MATRIEAFTEYGPGLDILKTVQRDELEEYIRDRTGLNRSEIHSVIDELNDSIIYFTRQGMAVKIEGLGIFRPDIRLEGDIHVHVRLDTRIDKSLNAPDAYTGPYLRRDKIGSSMEALIDLWNIDHPDDLIA